VPNLLLRGLIANKLQERHILGRSSLNLSPVTFHPMVMLASGNLKNVRAKSRSKIAPTAPQTMTVINKAKSFSGVNSRFLMKKTDNTQIGTIQIASEIVYSGMVCTP
jgi:hypothetical protein